MGEIAEVEKRPKAEERNLNQYRDGGAPFLGTELTSSVRCPLKPGYSVSVLRVPLDAFGYAVSFGIDAWSDCQISWWRFCCDGVRVRGGD